MEQKEVTQHQATCHPLLTEREIRHVKEEISSSSRRGKKGVKNCVAETENVASKSYFTT